jgi:hypothetical protein
MRKTSTTDKKFPDPKVRIAGQVAAPPNGPPDPGASTEAHVTTQYTGPGRHAQSTDAMNQY